MHLAGKLQRIQIQDTTVRNLYNLFRKSLIRLSPALQIILKLFSTKVQKKLFLKVQITYRSSKLKTEFDELEPRLWIIYTSLAELSTFGLICNEICTKFATNLQKRSFFGSFLDYILFKVKDIVMFNKIKV